MALLFREKIYTLLLIVFCLTSGCGSNKAPENPYIGNMDDVSYSGQVTSDQVIYRINANGRNMSVAEFKGRFVWSDYAATWCEPCVSQAKIIRQTERNLKEEVVFLTVITSAGVTHSDAPDQKTAKAWANRFGLNPERGVAATNLWGWKIPQHILFSPEGHTLYRSTGYLSAQQIKHIAASYMKDWEN